MIAESPETSLDAIRRDIDSIDDRILQLLLQRLAATARVKATKAQDGSIASSPFRPAREAAMMHRLIAMAGTSLNPEFVVRLWRVILSGSIQTQAPVLLHMDTDLGHDLAMRLAVAQYFCGMQVKLHISTTSALQAVARAPGDLAVIAPASDWAADFLAGAAGAAQVIVTLPTLANDSQPQLLVLGHAPPQPTGDDETLLLFGDQGACPADVTWQARSGTAILAGATGFLEDSFSLPPGARIAGRYPRSIKVSS